MLNSDDDICEDDLDMNKFEDLEEEKQIQQPKILRA